ncbi:hypothetical protein [Subtercola vilae]|uniref:Uncharacterized protein n=1 Tax=Subtercola vilae TaxID=2056433 RepID=A0A4T2BRG7_9MICO|nr:hypothetical protein [Subtercola vilae]TIH33669.1 hypothetical protein D4765_14395 [Subtercola vilae]
MIVTNATARKTIYGIYIIAVLAAYGIQVGFSSISVAQPSWLIATISVLAYLGAPVGVLAVANVVATPAAAPVVDAPIHSDAVAAVRTLFAPAPALVPQAVAAVTVDPITGLVTPTQ